ncbi:hypothetical protein [Aliiruegeria sabulilitoris]|uniref:hypothetical protein n=1 Tax=Aliiruegeria sabulilitoris TaxID=1510458 RepID=UPI0012E34224|nr:hypothetical protein [Aliiruegeria sabulilitoris]
MKIIPIFLVLFVILAGCASGNRKSEEKTAMASVKALCPADLSAAERSRTAACNFP